MVFQYYLSFTDNFYYSICIVSCINSIKDRVKEFLIAILILETFMIGVFCSLDLVIFYLFFEAGLIPMFLIIGVWGGDRRVYSAFKFFFIYPIRLCFNVSSNNIYLLVNRDY